MQNFVNPLEESNLDKITSLIAPLECEVNQIEIEWSLQKKRGWKRSLGKEYKKIIVDRAAVYELLTHGESKIREVAVEILAGLHWDANAVAALELIGTTDPAQDVRVAAIEEYGSRHAGQGSKHALSYLAGVASKSDCKDTALIAYIMLIQVLPISPRERLAYSVSDYASINWEIVRLQL